MAVQQELGAAAISRRQWGYRIAVICGLLVIGLAWVPLLMALPWEQSLSGAIMLAGLLLWITAGFASSRGMMAAKSETAGEQREVL